ncbi:TetR/AcrR family transcriptional regulator [Zavarzinia compransoris]|uniref:TetR/AcrR family transcriptional regulator n=1 Tax=Zavarzinia compransoris TaxID=1264899 RepID=A0A317E5J7_9PROT|nr:TetR/AcrR family transcriptional regulator [Zavarzinia compransoris]PWR21951.1 TetR/AcrR family transcriptional regulator [Zavarzinia compransoris]TDP47311.1 TetR family transcriptional regulator [Zavarzinia compransoris]
MPRKPRQSRAIATVDAIVEAGFISLARHGPTGTTTRHIAEIAGISVGSLYEYFANKEEIHAAMNRHFVAAIVGVIRPLIPRLVRMEIEPAIIALAAAFGDFLTRNDERYLKYGRATIAAHQAMDFGAVSAALTELLLQYVMQHPALTRLPDLAVMNHIFIQGGIFVVLKHLSDPDPPFGYDALAQGLARMVAHYVTIELQRADKARIEEARIEEEGGDPHDPAHAPL